MAQMRVSRKVTRKKIQNPHTGYEIFELKAVLGPMLTPITNSINILTETVNSLVGAWNQREGPGEKKNFAAEFTSSSINADMIAADTHRLAKNYSGLKELVCGYQQNLIKINEKLGSVEKLLATMVKRQAKRRNVDSTVLDVFQQFEHYLENVRKNEYSFSDNTAPPMNEGCSALDTGPMQILTLNGEKDYPMGSWLGNPNDLKSRVRCPLRSDDLVHINTKCTTPEKMALTLLDHLFSKEILAVSNLSGKSKLGKKKLDPLMVYGIKCHLMYLFGITEKQWEKIKLNIDSKCRTAWKKKRMTPEFCISLEEEMYPDDSQSKESLTDYNGRLTMREELEKPKTRVIRTLQGNIEVVAADQVLRFQDLHNIHVLDGDHILPIISSDGEDGESGIPLTRCSEQTHLAIVSEDASAHQSHLAIVAADAEHSHLAVVAEDSDLHTTDIVSFVMEPMMEVLTEGGSLITDSAVTNEQDKTIMLLPFIQMLWTNQTILWEGLQVVEPYLQGPILIYRDGSEDMFDMDTIIRIFSSSTPVIVAVTPHHPVDEHQIIPRSTVLLAVTPEPIVPNLRTWSLWAARNRVLVLLGPGACVRTWLSALWQFTRAVNVVAMVLGKKPEFYTWFPYKPVECSNVSTIVQLNSSNLYPNKVTSYLNKCPIIAITTPLPPTVIDEHTGIEPKIFHTIAEKLGLIATYHRLENSQKLWIQHDTKMEPVNGLKLLWENKVDVIFANFGSSYYRSAIHHAEFLASHTTDYFTFFIPAPRPTPRATAIYRAFTPMVWVATLSATLGIFFTVSLIMCFDSSHLRFALLPTLAFTLSLPCILPSPKTLLVFAPIAYVYSMHITTAYQAAIINFLSNVPREKPINTVQDLEQSHWAMYFLEGHRLALQKLSEEDPVIAGLIRPERVIFVKLMDLQEVAKGKRALLGPQLAFTFALKMKPDLYNDDFGYPLVKALSKEPLFSSRLNFMISKGHPLQPVLDRYTKYLVEAGLPEQFAHELYKPPKSRLRHREPFNLETVEGAFILYLSLVVVCFTIFLTELAGNFCMKTFLGKKLSTYL